MPKLNEVLEMFEKFGFSEREVKRGLGAGDSAHNAFEGLKCELMLKWSDMNQELGMEELKELKPVYQTLMGLKMTGRKTSSDVKKVRKAKAKVRAHSILDVMEQQKVKRTESFMEMLGEEFRKKDAQGKLDDETKKRIEAMGLGKLWKD